MMAKINRRQLDNFSLNIETCAIFDQSAENTIKYGLVEVIPEILFLSCLDPANDISTPTRSIFMSILDSFIISPANRATVARQFKAEDEHFIKFHVFTAAIATSLDVNIAKTIIGYNPEKTKDTVLNASIGSLNFLLRASGIAKSEKSDVIRPIDLARSLLDPTVITPQLKKAFFFMEVESSEISTIVSREWLKFRATQSVARSILTLPTEKHLELARPSQNPDEPSKSRRPEKDLDKLRNFGFFLTDQARAGTLDPIIGRDAELEQLIIMLGKRDTPNCAIVGSAGVGKSSLGEALAQRIVDGNVPSYLAGMEVFKPDTGAMVAGARYRGDFEEKIKNLIQIVSENRIILFIDEIHTFFGSGASDGSGNAGDLVKPAMSEKRLTRVIGTTTAKEYRRFIEFDEALRRRFKPLEIAEPTGELLRNIIATIAKRYQDFFGIEFTPDCTDTIIRASATAKSDKLGNSPSREADLLDEIGATFRRNGATLITSADIISFISHKTGVPIGQLSGDETERIRHLHTVLQSRIIGQDEAISTLTKHIRRHAIRIGGEQKKPLSFLFTGSSGVGKTEICRLVAQHYFPSKDHFTRIDMSEYMEQHSVSKLIGAPPGYTGFEEGGELIKKLRARPYHVVLFDEIEKAHPDVLNTLLQILEEGTLSGSRGEVADFSNAIIVCTTNVGSSAKANHNIGFNQSSTDQIHNEHFRQELKKHFRPEFLGRFDEIIVFHELQHADYVRIAQLQIADLSDRLQQSYNITLTVGDPNIFDAIATASASNTTGAREITHYIYRHIEDLISEQIFEGKLQKGDTAHIFASDQPDTYLLKTLALTTTEPQKPKWRWGKKD